MLKYGFLFSYFSISHLLILTNEIQTHHFCAPKMNSLISIICSTVQLPLTQICKFYFFCAGSHISHTWCLVIFNIKFTAFQGHLPHFNEIFQGCDIVHVYRIFMVILIPMPSDSQQKLPMLDWIGKCIQFQSE